MDRLKNVVLHPILIAAYPVLALFAYNIEESELAEVSRSLVVSVLAAILLLLVFRLLLRDGQKAAILTSVAVILFFSYGHVYGSLRLLKPFGPLLARHRFLAPLWLAMFAAAVAWLFLRRRNLGVLTQALNVIAALSVVFPLFRIGTYTISDLSTASAGAEQVDLQRQEGGQTPDIYYIILDAYARDDMLLKSFAYNNTPFLNELESMGFYVARCSQSNYAQTQLSISSSLNLNYLQKIDERFTGKVKDATRAGLPGMIKHSATRQYLEKLGYKTIAFKTGFHWTQIQDADLYLDQRSASVELRGLVGGINDFEALLIKTSAGSLIADGAVVLPGFLQPDLEYPNKAHRERILFILDQLGKLPEISGPKFVFAHLVAPHPPFVFGPNGEISIKDNEDMSGYLDQVTYLNTRLEELLPQIIARSKTPPIIIVQADHGMLFSSPKTRVSILNAYYLPGGGADQLYDTISPVNTFRLIFNLYFGGDFELLEDVTYYSIYQAPFDYEVVPETRQGCRTP